MILLDPKKIMSFIADVTNADDKECLIDVTKVPIKDKTIFIESKLESAKLDTAIHSME